MELKLQKHQQEAYNNVTKHFEEGNKSIVIFPTGCGKSFVSLKLLEDQKDKKILFMAPTKAIENQMYEYIIKYLLTDENKEKIEREEEKKDRKLSLKEKVEIILPKFKAMLYQTMISESERAKTIKDKLEPDYIICDEVHHIKVKDKEEGIEETEEELQKEIDEEANIWGTAMKEFLKKNSQAKVLGITATPERSDGINVAIDFFEGNIASEISLIEALTSNEIPVKTPDYVPCEYSLIEEIDSESIQTKIEKYRQTNPKRAEELLVKLETYRKIASSGKGIPDLFKEHLISEEAMKQGRNKGKYIIFCDSIEDMKSKMELAKVWFKEVDSQPEIYPVYSKQKNNEEMIEEFENSESEHIKLLYSVDMLNEGLHVDGVSGVIMSRKTDSRTIYLQQLGRALSSDETKNKPIVFDLANNYINYNISKELRERRKINFQESDYLRTDDEMSYKEENLETEKDEFSDFEINGEMQDLLDLLEEYNKERNIADEFIENLEILTNMGVDVSKMVTLDTSGSLCQKQNISNEKIEKNQINLKYKIGFVRSGLAGALRGTSTYKPPTEEQIRQIEKFGVSLNLQERNIADELIEKAEILASLGVDVSKVIKMDTIENLCEKQKIGIPKELEEQLNIKYKIGSIKHELSLAYRGSGHYAPPTEEQVIKLKQLGISLDIKKGIVEKFLESGEILKSIGIDVSTELLKRRYYRKIIYKKENRYKNNKTIRFRSNI